LTEPPELPSFATERFFLIAITSEIAKQYSARYGPEHESTLAVKKKASEHSEL
jgi:hypothetical protein